MILVAPPNPLGNVLDHADLKGSVISAIVTDLDGRVLFGRGSDLRVMPASNQKLFTVAYALDRLGPKYRAATRFWRDDESITIDSDGTLDLGYTELKTFADRFGRRPRVILRQAYRRGRPGTWQIGDVPNRYAPAITAFSCEKGGVELWSGPSGLEFHPPVVGITVQPMPAHQTKGQGYSQAIGAQSIAAGHLYDPDAGIVYEGEGTRAETPRRVDTLSQPAPDFSAARLFGETVEPDTADPALVRRRAPDDVLLSASVADVAPRCLKPSDNFLAESLFEMTKLRGLDPMAWGKSRVGLETGSFDPEDGSGLSRRNLITARSLAKLLRWTSRQPWAGLYRSSLAVPGEAGTLKERLTGVAFRGKTGTLTGASALSGYVQSASGRTLAVSLVVNHYACPAIRVRALQDQFIRAVTRLR